MLLHANAELPTEAVLITTPALGANNNGLMSDVCSEARFLHAVQASAPTHMPENDNAHSSCDDPGALFNPETSILIQKRHPYTGNLDQQTFWDTKNVFLH